MLIHVFDITISPHRRRARALLEPCVRASRSLQSSARADKRAGPRMAVALAGTTTHPGAFGPGSARDRVVHDGHALERSGVGRPGTRGYGAHGHHWRHGHRPPDEVDRTCHAAR